MLVTTQCIVLLALSIAVAVGGGGDPALLNGTSSTLSGSPSSEQTLTASLEISRSVTATVTSEQTLSASATGSASDEATLSETQSDEPTSTESVTLTGTATITPPPTPTRTSSLTDEGIMTFSHTMSVSSTSEATETITTTASGEATRTESLSETFTATLPLTPTATIPYLRFLGPDRVFEDAVITGEPLEDRTIIVELLGDRLDLPRIGHMGGVAFLFSCIDVDLSGAPSLQNVFQSIFTSESVIVSNNQSQYLTMIFKKDDRMWLSARRAENVTIQLGEGCVVGRSAMAPITVAFIPGSSQDTPAPAHLAHTVLVDSSAAALSVAVAASMLRSSPTLVLHQPRATGLATLMECRGLRAGLTIIEHPTRYSLSFGARASETREFLGALVMSLAIAGAGLTLHLVVVGSMYVRHFRDATGQRGSFSMACAAFPSRSVYLLVLVLPAIKCATVLGFTSTGTDTWLLLATISALLPWVFTAVLLTWVVFLAPVYAFTKRVPKRNPFATLSDDDVGIGSSDGAGSLTGHRGGGGGDASVVDVGAKGASGSGESGGGGEGNSAALLNHDDRGADAAANDVVPKPPSGNFLVEAYRRFWTPDQHWVWRRDDPHHRGLGSSLGALMGAAQQRQQRRRRLLLLHRHAEMGTYHYFIDRFGGLFHDFTGRCYWWLAAEIVTSTVAGLVDGMATAGAASCAAALWALAALYAVYAALLVRQTPFNVPFQAAVYLLNALLLLTAALLGAMGRQFGMQRTLEAGQIVALTASNLLLADAAIQLLLGVGTGLARNVRKGGGRFGRVDLVTVRRADGKLARGRDLERATGGAMPRGSSDGHPRPASYSYSSPPPPPRAEYSPLPQRPALAGAAGLSPMARSPMRRVSFTNDAVELSPSSGAPLPHPQHPLQPLPQRSSPTRINVGFGGSAAIPVPGPPVPAPSSARYAWAAPLSIHPSAPATPPRRAAQPATYWTDTDTEEDLSVYL